MERVLSYGFADLERVSIYSWFDFGFFRIAESDPYPLINDLTMVGDNLIEIRYGEKKGEMKLLLALEEGKLVDKNDDE